MDVKGTIELEQLLESKAPLHTADCNDTQKVREQYLDQVYALMLTNIISIICYPILAAFVLLWC